MEADVRMPLQPHVPLRLVGRQIVHDHMDVLPLMLSDDAIHEVEEFDPAATFVMPARNLPRPHVERGEQSGGPVTLVIVRLTGDGSPVGQFQITLGTFQRLDRRLLVNRQHHRIVGRHHVKADDIRRLRRELRVRALTPGFAAREVNLPGAQETPQILFVNVAQFARQLAARSSSRSHPAAAGRASPRCACHVPARILAGRHDFRSR